MILLYFFLPNVNLNNFIWIDYLNLYRKQILLCIWFLNLFHFSLRIVVNPINFLYAQINAKKDALTIELISNVGNSTISILIGYKIKVKPIATRQLSIHDIVMLNYITQWYYTYNHNMFINFYKTFLIVFLCSVHCTYIVMSCLISFNEWFPFILRSFGNILEIFIKPFPYKNFLSVTKMRIKC